MTKILLILILVLIALIFPAKIDASYAGKSASLIAGGNTKYVDYRVEALRMYLEQYNSPLAQNAQDFVMYADIYDLDWRLVAAIAGAESTFGKRIPDNSFNGWGWGVYGDNVIMFPSWKAGIETISKGLRENYLYDSMDSNPYVIGPKYASSPHWAKNVTYFMNRIKDHQAVNAKTTLSVNI